MCVPPPPGALAARPPLAPGPQRVTSVAFSLTLERVRGLNEPRRHVLREHFLADVVSQLGAPAGPLLVSQYLQRAHGRRGHPKRQRSVGAHRCASPCCERRIYSFSPKTLRGGVGFGGVLPWESMAGATVARTTSALLFLSPSLSF